MIDLLPVSSSAPRVKTITTELRMKETRMKKAP